MVLFSDIFLSITALFYLAGLIFATHPLLSKKENTSRLGRNFFAFGLGFHSVSFLLRMITAGYFPLSTIFESLSFFAWAVVAIHLLINIRFGISTLTAFIAPIAVILMGSSLFMYHPVRALNPALQSGWLGIHATLAFLSYGAFAVAFVTAIMYLLQERRLKHKLWMTFSSRLPSVEILDEANYCALVGGFLLLTLGILSGAIWAKKAWGDYWSWDPKETMSLVTWLVYLIILHARLTTSLRGRKVAVWSIVGFCFVLFTFLGVSYLLPGRHSYL